VMNGTGLSCALDEARREHRPRLVMRGSMQLAANKTVRVTVQLLNGESFNTIDADSSTLRKTNTASRPLTVARVAVKLLSENVKGAPAAQSGSQAGAAFESFAKAQYFWKQRNVLGLRQAIRFATQAIGEDPEFASAYVLLANCYATLIAHGEGIPVQLLSQAKEAVETALKLDPNLVVAHVALANLNVRFELDWVAAEGNYRHALDREPRSALAHHWYGNSLIAAGRFNEGIRSIESAFVLQPSSLSIRTARAQAYYLAGYVAECQRQLEDILDMNPAFTPAYFGLGMTNGVQGKATESLSMFRRAAKMSGGKSFYLASLAYAHSQWGQKRHARKILQHLLKLAHKCYVPYYDLALLHACMGNNDAAVEMFGKAVDNRDALVMWMKVDPRLEALRKQGALQNLISRFRLSARKTTSGR
jgi:tetratricopeptide (TPR) repeat protein